MSSANHKLLALTLLHISMLFVINQEKYASFSMNNRKFRDEKYYPFPTMMVYYTLLV